MSKHKRFGAAAAAAFLALCSSTMNGQTAPPADQTTAPPQPVAAPVSAPALKPVQDPYIIEDGGFSIAPMYWLNHAQPTIAAGRTATSPGVYDFQGDANAAIGGELGVPAGRSNTVRLSYFRLQGNSNATLPNDTAVFSQGYLAGDYLTGSNTIQAMKVSWDYLSYTWRKPNMNIRLKTLYEVQYITVRSGFVAPFKAITTDSTGNANDNTATGSKSVVLPTLGMALVLPYGKHFRVDLRGSGMGWPHGSAIGDVQATAAFRVGPVEIFGGEKFLYFKTSPKSDESFNAKLNGVTVGVRYYFKTIIKTH